MRTSQYPCIHIIKEIYIEGHSSLLLLSKPGNINKIFTDFIKNKIIFTDKTYLERQPNELIDLEFKKINVIKKEIEKSKITKTNLAKELGISIQILVNYLNLHSDTPHIEYKLEKWLLSRLNS
jgi:hypothetical protein